MASLNNTFLSFANPATKLVRGAIKKIVKQSIILYSGCFTKKAIIIFDTITKIK